MTCQAQSSDPSGSERGLGKVMPGVSYLCSRLVLQQVPQRGSLLKQARVVDGGCEPLPECVCLGLSRLMSRSGILGPDQI